MALVHLSGGILQGMDFLAGANSTLRCGEIELDITTADDEESNGNPVGVSTDDE